MALACRQAKGYRQGVTQFHSSTVGKEEGSAEGGIVMPGPLP